MAFPTGLRALNHREFRAFYGAQLVSLTGTWMHAVAQSWLVLELTDSPFRLGLIGTLQFLPMLLLSVLAGAVADRVPKRRLLIGTQAALAAQALGLGLLVSTGHVAYWHVGTLALVAGLASTLDHPARQALVIELVGRDDVVNAVALNSAAFNAARVVGPAVGGLLIARFGVVPAFLVNGVSFAAVIAVLLGLGVEGPSRSGRGSLRAEIGEGLRYALRTPRVRLILALLFVVSLCVFNFSVFVPLLAREALGLGAQGFGFCMAAVGVGAVTGALGLGAAARPEPPLPLVFAAGLVACAGLLGLSAGGGVWTAVPLLFAVGLSAVAFVASCNTALQLAAPDALRGRVMSLYTLIFGGTFPIGALLTGSLAEAWGVRAALAAAGAAGLVGLGAIVAWWLWTRRRAG